MKRLLFVLLVSFNVYGSQNNENPADQLLPDFYFSQATLDTINKFSSSSYNPPVTDEKSEKDAAVAGLIILASSPQAEAKINNHLIRHPSLDATKNKLDEGQFAADRAKLRELTEQQGKLMQMGRCQSYTPSDL
ncbi:MAG: hypothetical protein Q8Q60_05300 [Candidatus Chromulinivorax sp.]|nr:hypothetical protein [Candidatus Chromulinivorax sp.]